jgi:SlyX protein
MSEITESRIVDLEIRFMRQEKTLQDLSDVLVAQLKAIDRLTAEIAMLRERLPDQSEAVGNDPPPHY